MNNTKPKKSKDKNLIFIGVFSFIIIIILAVIIIYRNSDKTSLSSNSGQNTSQVTTAMTVLSENGDQNATLSADITLRNSEFSTSIKKIKSYEKTQDDTLGEPNSATSEDGYTYLQYKFNPDNPLSVFGAQVLPSDINAMLTYVFYNKKLTEVRVQYGNIGKSAFDQMVSANNSTYGNATYSRSYSNGTEEYWWKTDDSTLDIIYQTTGVIAYFRSND